MLLPRQQHENHCHRREDLDGWLAGIGMETRCNPLTLRLEYRYSRFNDIEGLGIATGLDATRNQVVAGALFSF